MAMTSAALKLVDQMAGDNPQVASSIAEASFTARIAQLAYDGRTQAGMTQEQLAELVGTTQSAIARLEDADYDGHSLSMLQRIAEALDQQLKIHLIPKKLAA